MGDPRKCPNCGAIPSQNNLLFCGFCGTELPALEASAAQHFGKPLGNLEARFAALESHSSLPAILQQTPSSGSTAARMIGQGVFGIIFAVIALFMVPVFFLVGGPLAIFPMIFVVIGAVIAVGGFKSSAKFNSAPLQRLPVGIVDERVKVSGGGKNSSASTNYFATLQTQSGERGEYRVDEQIAGAIAPGDVGIAFIKSDYLIDFSRVDV